MKVSVVIPTWNEEAILEESLLSLKSQEGEFEIVVADGGSQDRTREIAARHARCVIAPKGRGVQMNAGAGASKGEVLLFLHADCRLAPGAIEEAWQILDQPEIKAGCFPQRIQSRAPVYRLVEWAASFRSRRLGIVYGDSALFLRRETFDRCGGFPPVPLFEDFGISQRLKKLPGKIALAKSRVQVSPRRWKKRGFLRTTWMNWSLAISYLRGTSPEILSRRYEQS